MAKKKKKKKKEIEESNRGRDAFTCSECCLIFTLEDLREGLFYQEESRCSRCFLLEKLAKAGVEKPTCFGELYDPSTQQCSSDCALRKACRIEFIEDSYISIPKATPRYSHQTLSSHIIRILRAVGKPVYISDLAATVGREVGCKYKDLKKFESHLIRLILEADEVISLGGNFFVWCGVWDMKNEGSTAYIKPLRRGGKSIDELFKELEERR